MDTDTSQVGEELDMYPDCRLFQPDGSNIWNLRCKLSGKWYSKTADQTLKLKAKAEIPRVVKEICEKYKLPLPPWHPQYNGAPVPQTKSTGKSLVHQAKAVLDRRAKEGRWKSEHIYYNAFGYMETGLGQAGTLHPKLVPRAVYMKLRDFLTDCPDIAKSASEYARRIRWILKQVDGVKLEYLDVLKRLPGGKGDGEKGETLDDSQLRTVLSKRWEEEDETTQILIEMGLCGGPQMVDAVFPNFSGINFESGMVSFHRVKSKEEVRFLASPRLLELFRKRRERLRKGAVYVLEDIIFTQEQREKADCNTTLWEGDIPKEFVNRASVQGNNKMRKFLRERCGFTSLKITNKSFRIHRISFWASVGFKLKTRMRMAGHKSVQRHTDYDRGADFEIRRAAEVSWKYYDAIEHGRPFFIPTTPYDLYEIIEDHWKSLPQVVQHSIAQALGGSFENLERVMRAAFAEQRAHFDQRMDQLACQIKAVQDQVQQIADTVNGEKAWIHARLTAVTNHFGISLPSAV